MTTPTVAPEFSRPIDIEDLAEEGIDVDVEATAAEAAALAERFGLVSVDALRATVQVVPIGGGAILSGRFEADVVQSCVVTLEPVPAHLSASFERRYVTALVELSRGEIEVPHDEEEPPEPLSENAVDVGEAVAEQLGLELDPFPRAPGAVFEGLGNEQELEAEHPFAVLAKLKKDGS